MTALSLSFFIPHRHSALLDLDDSCMAGGFEEDTFNAMQCRRFLFSIESLLHKQWRRYHYKSGRGSVPKLRPVDTDVAEAYFPCHCIAGRVRERNASCGETKRRMFVGSNGSGHLRDFIYRLLCHSRCSVECYPLTLALVDRFFLTIGQKKLLATAYVAAVDYLPYVFASLLLITSKFRDDHFRSNRYFSQLVELPLGEWNALERLIARVLQYDVRVPVCEYIAYEKLVLKEMVQHSARISAPHPRGSHPHDKKHDFNAVSLPESCVREYVVGVAKTEHAEVGAGEEEETVVKENSSFCSGGVTTSSTISPHMHFSTNGSPTFEADVVAGGE